jgi:hypothetical protein
VTLLPASASSTAPVDHHRRVEFRRPGQRFRTASRRRNVTDRVEQGKPELLGVLLVALHLQPA